MMPLNSRNATERGTRRLIATSVTTRWVIWLTAGCGMGLVAACGTTFEAVPQGGRPPMSVSSKQLAGAPSGSEGPYRVLSVTDGDTIRVDVEGVSTRVRLIGIDTPEVRDPRKPVQCFGKQASERAHELLDGRAVRLEFDPTQGRTDRYGRLLAYVWLNDGSMVNESMVRDGYAHEYTYGEPYKYRGRLKEMQRSASEAGRGLWAASTCEGDTAQPAPQ